jgi:hypothetical protein
LPPEENPARDAGRPPGAAAGAPAQNTPAEPKNYSIDPWHINVPRPVADPVTSVTEKIPGSDLAEIIADTITYLKSCLK